MKEGRRGEESEEDDNGLRAHKQFVAIYIIIIAKFRERKLCIKCSRFLHCSPDDGPSIFDLSMHDDYTIHDEMIFLLIGTSRIVL